MSDLYERAQRVKHNILQWRAKYGPGLRPGEPAQAAADMIDELLALVKPPVVQETQSHSQWLNVLVQELRPGDPR